MRCELLTRNVCAEINFAFSYHSWVKVEYYARQIGWIWELNWMHQRLSGSRSVTGRGFRAGPDTHLDVYWAWSGDLWVWATTALCSSRCSYFIPMTLGEKFRHGFSWMRALRQATQSVHSPHILRRVARALHTHPEILTIFLAPRISVALFVQYVLDMYAM